VVSSPRHLVHVFPGFGIGGAQVRTSALINHFATRYRHTVIALDRCTDARALIAPGLDVGVVGVPGPGRLPGLGRLQLWRWLSLLEPDLLLTYGWQGLRAAMVNRWRRIAPPIHHLDGLPDDERFGERWHHLRLRRLVLPGADRVVVPSRHLEAMALERWRVRRARLVRIANGVDVARFERPPKPHAIPGFEPGAGELVVGTVARMRPAKNLERLVRVFATAPNHRAARLVIVGDGPTRGDLVKAIVDRGLETRVVLPGQLLWPERYLGHFDVFALASDAEEMPLGVIEAMAAGLAVVATDVGDVKAMVSEPNRELIVAPDNEAGLAAKLDALLRDHQMRARLGRANRAKAREELTFAPMAEAYGELYAGSLGAPDLLLPETAKHDP